MVIRAVWQIVAIPTAGTMLIFIPLILALVGVDLLFVYLTAKPDAARKPLFLAATVLAFTAGLVAGVSHFVRFIMSPLADPFLSKVISTFILLGSLTAYFMVLWIVRSLWTTRRE